MKRMNHLLCHFCWRSEQKQKRIKLHLFLRIFVILLSIWGLIDLCILAAPSVRQRLAWHNLTGADPTCYFGNPTSEALSLGCKYTSLPSRSAYHPAVFEVPSWRGHLLCTKDLLSMDADIDAVVSGVLSTHLAELSNSRTHVCRVAAETFDLV